MKKSNVSGFTLIELSVVLIIIAVILGTSLSSIMSNLNAVKRRGTEEKLEVIQMAIKSFLIQNKRLPCPADGSLTKTDAAFGDEDFNTGTDQCNATTVTTGNVLYGVVPVTTLGLQPNFILDEWDRRITYTVDRRLAGNNIGSQSFYDTSTAELDLRISTNATIENVAYVLFSHGPNSHGAWAENGGSQISKGSTPGSEEFDNTHLDENLLLSGFDNEFVQWADETDFDDIVVFKTKAALVGNLDGIFATALCPDAVEVTDELSGVCVGSANQSACEQLILAVKDRCVFTP